MAVNTNPQWVVTPREKKKIDLLGRYARVVDHLAVRDVAQGAPLGGGSTVLCSLHETIDRNHLGRCTALSSRTECERYWEARTKMMEN
jgi:hypothetical protein